MGRDQITIQIPSGLNDTLVPGDPAPQSGEVRGTKVPAHVIVLNDGTDPIPISLVPGTKIHDYNEVLDLAKDTSDNHDRVIPDGTTFRLLKVICSSSGEGTFELQLGDGAASETFSTIAKTYSDDDAQTNPDIEFGGLSLDVVGTTDGRTIRIIRTNDDNQDLDMNTTFVGADE